MRRLPIFFLLDVSESMVGPGISQMEQVMTSMVNELRGDPHALETVHLSIIAFAGKARRLTSLVDLTSFYLPQLPLGGGTSLGAGLECLMMEIDSQVQRRSATARGDYKPVVYLLTDGRPTDDFQSASAIWREKYAKRCDLIAIALGQAADAGVLKDLTEKTYVFNPEAPQSYAQLARWVSASISIQSQSVNSTGVSLAKPDGNALSFLDKALAKMRSDEEVLIVPGKCSNTRQSYLLRYIPATALYERASIDWLVAGTDGVFDPFVLTPESGGSPVSDPDDWAVISKMVSATHADIDSDGWKRDMKHAVGVFTPGDHDDRSLLAICRRPENG